MTSKKDPPAPKIEWRDPSALHPHPRNTNTHSAEQIDQIANMIDLVGWTKPIIVDENDVILAGHGACMAAIQRSADRVPVLVKKDLSEERKRAYLIADNKIAQNAEWDFELLKSELDDLIQFPEISADIMGFSDEDMKMFKSVELSDGSGEGGESNGLKTMVFHVTPDQYEVIYDVLQRNAHNAVIDPLNPSKFGNVLFWAIKKLDAEV